MVQPDHNVIKQVTPIDICGTQRSARKPARASAEYEGGTRRNTRSTQLLLHCVMAPCLSVGLFLAGLVFFKLPEWQVKQDLSKSL